MADEKKLQKLKDSMFYVGRVAIIVVFAFFGWLKLSEKNIYMFGTVFDCYTFAFFSGAVILGIKLYDYIKKNGNKFKLTFDSFMIVAALAITGICLINSFAKDTKNSRIKEVVPLSNALDNDVSVVMCEVAEFNNMVNNYSTKIKVYLANGRIARKIGEIDEVYFSAECIKEGRVTNFIDNSNNTITIECSYGTFGDGIVMMNPDYATGQIRYVFKLD